MLSKGGNKHMRTLNNTEWGGGGRGWVSRCLGGARDGTRHTQKTRIVMSIAKFKVLTMSGGSIRPSIISP